MCSLLSVRCFIHWEARQSKRLILLVVFFSCFFFFFFSFLCLDALYEHFYGHSCSLPPLFPLQGLPFESRGVRVGDHIMVLCGPAFDAVTHTLHAMVVTDPDPVDGSTVVTMHAADGATRYQKQTLRSFLTDSGVDRAELSRITIIRSGSDSLSEPADMVKRAEALCSAEPQYLPPHIARLWDQFAFGFFCQTGHLVEWPRFVRWGRDLSTNI